MNGSPERVLTAGQHEMRPCAICRGLFQPKRPSQVFCCEKHKQDFHRDVGTEGAVASVRRINSGVSLIIHLTGPAAERALGLNLQDLVRVVPKP